MDFFGDFLIYLIRKNTKAYEEGLLYRLLSKKTLPIRTLRCLILEETKCCSITTNLILILYLSSRYLFIACIKHFIMQCSPSVAVLLFTAQV